MTIQQAYQQLLLQLYEIYDEREAANIAELVIEKVTGFQKIDRILNKTFPLNTEQQEEFDLFTKQLLKNRPVQYVLGEAWFAGIKLFVDENVLIPRPETEELVEWIVAERLKIENRRSKADEDLVSAIDNDTLSILDIGTGSGCIPISLKKKFNADISAIDVSAGALEVAARNAEDQQVDIAFYQIDFLDESSWDQLEQFDIIVSNPPYIKQSEEVTMRKNVLTFEPGIALFVADEDALIFYRKIALFSQEHLKKAGVIFLEINEALAREVLDLFKSSGYSNVQVKKDMQGKDRMVQVWREW